MVSRIPFTACYWKVPHTDATHAPGQRRTRADNGGGRRQVVMLSQVAGRRWRRAIGNRHMTTQQHRRRCDSATMRYLSSCGRAINASRHMSRSNATLQRSALWRM